MDQQKLRSLVFEKTGIKIDTSDPVFAVVAMNEALLEEAVQRHLLVLEQSSKAILQQLQALRAQASGEAIPVAAAHDDIWENSNSNTSQTAHKSATTIEEGTGLESVSESTAAASSTSSVSSATNQSPSNFATSPAPANAFVAQLRIAALTALMTVALMLPTLGMFAPKANTPASGTAPTLTPQQESQLKQYEKLQKLLPTLDAKTRTQIETELKKP